MEVVKARKISLEVPEEQLLADLEKYRLKALELGADKAKVIPASLVVIDERVRLKCAVPRCHLYGESPNCPPYTPVPEEMRKVISKYRYAVVFAHAVSPLEDFVDDKQWHAGHARHQKKAGEVATQIEALGFNDGYYLAAGFGAGGCKTTLCNGLICQFLDSGRCRFPLRSRPSMEATGIDVFRLVTQIGWDIYPVAHCNVDISSISSAMSVGIVFIH